MYAEWGETEVYQGIEDDTCKKRKALITSEKKGTYRLGEINYTTVGLDS